MIKVGVYSPYLKMMGGGERYILSIASLLSQKYEVYLWGDEDILEKSRLTFNINLERVHLLSGDLLRRQNLFNRFMSLRQYNLFFYMTDGSLFFSGAGKNYLIIQSPLHIPRQSVLNSIKLLNYHLICYSKFMESIIRDRLGRKIRISTLAPCIDVKTNAKRKKENIILSVGRFFPYPHDKKHSVLVGIFKKNFEKHFSDWQLVIAGGLTEEGGNKIFEDLKKKSAGFPIKVIVNPSSAELVKLYQRTKLYWHAAGFGEDLVRYPERAEHFGITPLEAMANGAVPLVFNAGGLKDIVCEAQGGYLWNSPEELVDKTVHLITNEKLLNEQAIIAANVAKNYSCDTFYEKLEKIIER